MTQLMDEKQAAALLNVSIKCLQGWRYRGAGPRFAKLGRSVKYAISDLEALVQAAIRTSTSDPGAPPPKRSRVRLESLLEHTGRTLGRPEVAPSPSGKPQ
jgi:hypothetical protein